jgi:hypothetical protein
MISRPVRIYSTCDIPRLRYIAGIILGDILGLSWELINDKRKLGKHPVINYSNDNIAGALKISPDKLLFETGLSDRQIDVSEWKGLPVFFQTNSDSDLPFDIFAASFYLVTRYEEYLEYQPDDHGRFPASSSLAFRKGFLQIPVIDYWAREMSKIFLKKFQDLVFRRNEYKALLTFDSDQPFAYLGKSLFRTLGGLINDIKTNGGKAAERYNTVAKGEKDPFEVFDYITEKITDNRCDAKFFFPVGETSKYDKNPSWKNSEYRKLIINLSGKYSFGLHPSYNASANSLMLKEESDRLKEILLKEVISSRFHYIRLFTPESYHRLIGAGITEDYSMGYPDEPGFRAGIARPYFFYDVKEDKQTNLKVFPFQIMDATLYQYKKLNTSDSGELILKIINETKKAGGMFVSIWHNTSLLDNKEWLDWRKVFETMLKNQAL